MPSAPARVHVRGLAEGEILEVSGCLACQLERIDILDGADNPFHLFRHYQTGHLLEAGGWNDQPARYCDCMELIQALVDEDERRMIEERRKEHERKRTANKR